MAIDLKNPIGSQVAIVGTGVSGQSAARLLQSLGAQISLFDEKNGAIEDFALCGFDAIVLSPGFPRRKACIANALATGVPVLNEIDVGAVHMPQCRFIGVTGTNGKSTTTAMIGEILKLQDHTAFVGGNLGRPLCDAVFAGESPSLGVIELSSYQLETLRELQLDVAVVTHLTPDHLDRYDSAVDYYAAKNRIFSLLTPDGFAIVNGNDANSQKYLHPASEHRVVNYAELVMPALPYVVGAHNLENAAAAFAATKVMGFDESMIEKALVEFKGLAHRLEYLGEKNGVRWFNDSKATNVESAIIAVKCFERGVHLIVGGLGKGASYAPLVDACHGRVEKIYTIGQDAPVIESAFSGHLPCMHAGTLDRAVSQATQVARPGDVILLAPACASFDQYPNYGVRGDEFRQLFSAHGAGQ